jgi:hypothetical protein
MAKNPDPVLKLATDKGVVRTLDDWSTMFHLVLVILPDRPEAKNWLPVGERIFKVLGDADCRTAYVVPSTPEIAERILGSDETRTMTFVDPDKELIASLGITRLPAFVHLRQDTTVAAAAEGWNPAEWQDVANEIGKAMSWSVPEIKYLSDPPRSDGFPVA